MCSRSTSGRPTRSIRSRIPTTRPRRRTAFRTSATSSWATRSIPTTGTSIRGRRPQEITDSVFHQIADMETRPWMRGSIILLHDGGGDRSATIQALPVLIDALRAHGYQIVPVSELMGKTRAEVMPPLTQRSAVGGSRRFDCVLRVGLLQPLRHCGLLRRRHPDERAADHHWRLRRHRPLPQAQELCRAGLCAARRRSDPRVQRREGDRADHPLGDDVELQEHSRHRDRRWFQGQHLPRRDGCLSGRHRFGAADRADQAERRQGRCVELCAGPDGRRSLRRHRC